MLSMTATYRTWPIPAFQIRRISIWLFAYSVKSVSNASLAAWKTSIQMCFMTAQAHVQARTYVCVFARIHVRVGLRTHRHKQNKHLFVFVAWHKCFYTVETEYFWIYWGIVLCSILTVDNFSIYSRWVVGSTKLLLDWCILYILYIAGRDRTP